jgi:hypothetical protein
VLFHIAHQVLQTKSINILIQSELFFEKSILELDLNG